MNPIFILFGMTHPGFEPNLPVSGWMRWDTEVLSSQVWVGLHKRTKNYSKATSIVIFPSFQLPESGKYLTFAGLESHNWGRRDTDSEPAGSLVCAFLAAATQQSWPPVRSNFQKTSSSLTSKHLVTASATSMVGFPALVLSVRSWNNGLSPRSPVHRLCLLSFSGPPPTARCPSQGRGPSHSQWVHWDTSSL